VSDYLTACGCGTEASVSDPEDPEVCSVCGQIIKYLHNDEGA
jgi:hypothetical protein